MQRRPDAPKRRWTWVVPAAVVLVLAAGIGWALQPWTLFTDSRVTEAMPGSPTGPRTSAAPAPAGVTPTPTPTPTPTAASSAAPSGVRTPECACDQLPRAGPRPGPDGAGRTVLRTGFFIDQEHPTSGTVSVLQLPDGRRFLRLEDLATGNGPALRIWLSTTPTRPGQNTWSAFGESDHRDLGPLKGNLGDQNYEIPADVDLTTMVSVAIWSNRYTVSYGAASLQG